MQHAPRPSSVPMAGPHSSDAWSVAVLSCPSIPGTLRLQGVRHGRAGPAGGRQDQPVAGGAAERDAAAHAGHAGGQAGQAGGGDHLDPGAACCCVQSVGWVLRAWAHGARGLSACSPPHPSWPAPGGTEPPCARCLPPRTGCGWRGLCVDEPGRLPVRPGESGCC